MKKLILYLLLLLFVSKINTGINTNRYLKLQFDTNKLNNIKSKITPKKIRFILLKIKNDNTGINIIIKRNYQYYIVAVSIIFLLQIFLINLLVVIHIFRKKIENELIEREKQYKNLFNNMLDGFAVHEMIFDQNKNPINYKFLAVNPAFEKQTGLSAKDIIGKNVLEIIPDIDKSWIQNYGEVVLTGNPICFENISFQLNKHYEVFAYSPAPGKFACVFHDITELKKAEKKIKASLIEKDILLKEIHHRVKNNMQVISSMLGLQILREKNPHVIEILTQSSNRIQTMATIHERLYHSNNLESLNMKNAITQLANNLSRIYNKDNIKIKITSKDLFFNVNLAIPCSLILNELISNSFKYAFPGNKEGIIKINLDSTDDEYIMSVSDNGIGLENPIEIKNADTLGYKIINVLVTQINGSISLTSTRGVNTILRIPKKQDLL